MPNEVQLTLRLPADLVERVDELVPVIDRHPELMAYGRISRAGIMRLALADGIRRLERRAAAAEAEED